MSTQTFSNTPGKLICEVRISNQPLGYSGTTTELLATRRPATLEQIELIEKQSNHDMAIIRVTLPGKTLLWSERSPVKITWGFAPTQSRIFYGYINHFEYLENGTVELWCVGSSFPLKTQRQTVWKNVTPSYIAKRIAQDHKLVADVDALPNVGTYAQAGKSDFKFLSDLALESGFTFSVSGGVLHFLNPLNILRLPPHMVPIFNNPGDVRSFSAIVGEQSAAAGDLSNRIKYGMDAVTGALLIAKEEISRYESFQDKVGAPAYFTKFSNIKPADSVARAKQDLLAELSVNQHWIEADAVLRGDARVRPLTVVELEGTGMPYQQNGTWMVTEAHHKLNLTFNVSGSESWTHEMTCRLARDQVYALNTVIRAEWITGQKPIAMVLQNGQWVTTGG